MRMVSRGWLAGMAMAVGGVALADNVQYSDARYQPILDRAPFGVDELLPGVDENTAAQAAQAALTKDMRLCMLLKGENGEVRAGFQNLKPGPGQAQSAILRIGESYAGAKLLDIDMDDYNATMQRNGQTVVFKLEKGAEPAPAPAAAPPQPQRRFGGGFRNTEAPPAAQPAPQPAQPEVTEEQREEMRNRMREYQMEVIRKGMPPLPIPLTKEMDDQLVSEGVLPPMEDQGQQQGQ